MKSGVYLLSIRKKIVINDNQAIGGSETKYQKYTQNCIFYYFYEELNK